MTTSPRAPASKVNGSSRIFWNTRSLPEVDSQLERGRALKILDADEARKLLEQVWEVRRMLTALHRAVKRRAEAEEDDDEEKEKREKEGDGDSAPLE